MKNKGINYTAPTAKIKQIAGNRGFCRQMFRGKREGGRREMGETGKEGNGNVRNRGKEQNREGSFQFFPKRCRFGVL